MIIRNGLKRSGLAVCQIQKHNYCFTTHLENLMSQYSNFKKSAPAQTLMGFVPSLVLQNFTEQATSPFALPFKQQFTSVVMFADISGFTEITENLSQKGPEGAELIAFAINKYMELLVSTIGRSGGDIFKFAGGTKLICDPRVDAIIVIWPPPNQAGSNLQSLCRKAVQSALDIQQRLTDTQMLPKIKLSVKIGFGVGEISVIYVGGVLRRCEYLPAGLPLTQAFQSEHLCSKGGETIVSMEVYNMVSQFFSFEPVSVQGKSQLFYRLMSSSSESKEKMKADALIMKNQINPSQFHLIKHLVLPYIPAALLPYIDIDEEKWSSELRYLTIVFINLGIDLRSANQPDGLQRIQKIIEIVQKCVYMHEGSLNKLLMDDKGSTLVVVFGLPPMTHQDDPVRAILMSFLMIQELDKQQVSCSVGIATGTVFTGVIGTAGGRREYSVLGDKVNLAARLMQQAQNETDLFSKVLCCSQTVQDGSNKIKYQFYKSKLLKGYKIETNIYLPLMGLGKERWYDPFPQIKLHIHQIQLDWLKSQQDSKSSLPVTSDNDQSILLDIIGREEQIKDIQLKVDRFLKGKDKKGVYILSGSYGVGKSQILKYILNKIQKRINRAPYIAWKYGEKNGIFISQMQPLDRNKKLNGLRTILIDMFKIIAQRKSQKPDKAFFESILKPEDFITNNYKNFIRTLDLGKTNQLNNFPPPPPHDDPEEKAFEQRQFKAMTFALLSQYFEIVQINLIRQSSANEMSQSMQGESFPSSPNQTKFLSENPTFSLMKPKIAMNNLVAPVILCFEDMQNFDQLTFYILKSIIKNFSWVFVIGCVRDQNIEIPINFGVPVKSFGQKRDAKHHHETFMEGIGMLENAVEKHQFTQTIIKNLLRNDQNDEFDYLLKNMFGIHEFRMMHQQQQKEEKAHIGPAMIKTKQEQPDLKLIVLEQNTNKILQDQLLFSINKWELIRRKFNLYMSQFLYFKTQGHPLVTIQLMTHLKQSGLIVLESKTGIGLVTPELRKIVEHEEMLTLMAPTSCVQINGPLIDRLGCLESLLMKVASVIGDVFDLQTLNKINPFKGAINYDMLSKILRELDKKDFIEIMDITENNIYYRFTALNTREVIYQRMTYSQRRELHRNVAEAIHTLPQLPDSDEKKDQYKLEFHWTQTENHNKSEHSKVLSDGNKFQRADMFSQKAKRSMIVKQIQQILARSNNNPSAEIKIGILDKKSDSNITWANRFCVINSKSFMYYYTREDYKLQKESYLGAIFLKNIFSVHPLQNDMAGNRKKVFILSASSWLKKNKEMSKREFYFAASNDLDVEQWTIFLEFAKAKAIYDDFVENFGKIQFPIGSALQQYDPSISMQVNTLQNRSNKLERSQIRFTVASLSGKERTSRASKFLAKIQRQGTQGLPDDQRDQMTQIQIQEIKILKGWINNFFYKSFLIFFAQICEMSLQKDERVYKKFGQTPKFVVLNNNLFRIDREKLSMGTDKRRSRMTRIDSQDDIGIDLRVSLKESMKPQRYDAVAGDHLLQLSFNSKGQSRQHQLDPILDLQPIVEVLDQAQEEHSLVRQKLLVKHGEDSREMTNENQFPSTESEILSYSQFLQELSDQVVQPGHAKSG